MRKLVSGVFKLVADRANEVGLNVVQQTEFGHILQDDRRALELRELVADGEDARQVMAVLARDPQGNDPAVVGRQVVITGRKTTSASEAASAGGNPWAKAGDWASCSAAGLRNRMPGRHWRPRRPDPAVDVSVASIVRLGAQDFGQSGVAIMRGDEPPWC